MFQLTKRICIDKQYKALFGGCSIEDLDKINKFDSFVASVWNNVACFFLGHRPVGSLGTDGYCGHCTDCDKLVDKGYCDVHKPIRLNDK